MNIICACFGPNNGTVNRITSLDYKKFGYDSLTFVFVKAEVGKLDYYAFADKVKKMVIDYFGFDKETKHKFLTEYAMSSDVDYKSAFENYRKVYPFSMPYEMISNRSGKPCKDVFYIEEEAEQIKSVAKAILSGVDGLFCEGRCKNFFPYAESTGTFVCTSCRLWSEMS